MPLDDIFQEVMDGARVTDWPLWMTTQEDYVYWLTELEKNIPEQKTREERLFGGIMAVILMLMFNLKDILGEPDPERLAPKIHDFADKTASILVRLALSGVSSLVDFTTKSTPERVKVSYEIVIKHLQTSQPTMECLAAAVILLEYALERGVIESSK